MRNAPLPVGLSSQTPQGGGARIFHRFGGAVRSVIAAGVALTGRQHRPTAPRPDRTSSAATDDPALRPSPRRKPTARRPRTAAPVTPPTPARSGWLARWFGRKRPQPVRRPPAPATDDTPFTPAAYPGLSPEACAFFNTPVEECDPDELRLVLAAFAAQIAESLPPELGMDAKALLATLSERLCTPQDEAGPDAPPVASEDAVPQAAPQDALPQIEAADALPQAEPDDAVPQATPEGALPQAEPEGALPQASEHAVSHAPPDAPLPILEPEPADAATMAPTVAKEARPDAVAPAVSVFRRPSGLSAASCSFRRRHALLAAGRSFRRRRRGVRRRLSTMPHQLPARRLCYAACAGPP